MKTKNSSTWTNISPVVFYWTITTCLVLSLGSIGGYWYTWENYISEISNQALEIAQRDLNREVLGEEVSVDQTCQNTNPDTFELIEQNTPNEQSFRPQHNRLSSVVLKIGGANMNGDTSLKLTLLTQAGYTLTDAVITPNSIEGGAYRMWEFNNYEMIQGQVYLLRLEKLGEGGGTPYWYTAGTNCAAYGNAIQANIPYEFDFDFATYGTYVPVLAENPPAATTPATTTTPTTTTATTTTTTTTPTTKVTVTAAAPVVAPSVLAVPMNFAVDRNEDEQIIFSWDLNTEANLAGYVLYVYEAKKEVELETINIDDKELDNYNLALADHPLMKLGSEYDVKLAAKNTDGAVSEKTLSLRIKFNEKAATVVTEKVMGTWATNPYILGGLALLFLLIVGTITFVEIKFHYFSNMLKKLKKS